MSRLYTTIVCIGIYVLFILIAYGDTSQSCVDSRSRPGQCVALSACPHLIEEFYDTARSTSYATDFQTFVSESICGFDGTNFLICCPPRTVVYSPLYIRPVPSLSASQVMSSTQRSPPNYSALDLLHFASLNGPSVGGGGGGGSSMPAPSVPPVSVFQPLPMPMPTPMGPSTPTRSTATQPVVQGECGISLGTTNRVVGGSEAKRRTYPWIAALGYREYNINGNELKFLCSGSLISASYILTSAHCVHSTLVLVRLGAHDLSNPSEADAIDFRVQRSIVHENFNTQSIANDIALIKMSSPAPHTNAIGPICLPESSHFLMQNFEGSHPFVAGWGAIKHQGPTSNVLRDVQVPIVSRQTCSQNYKTVFQFIEFSDKLICAGNANVDACQGDSGGPLMMPQLNGNGAYRYYLLGIVSYGYECARSGFPGVYTRVASYMPWIQRNMI